MRSLAKKEIQAKSLHKFEEEKQAVPPIASYNRQKARRRSTLVTDIIQTVAPPKEKKTVPKERKASLVSDVIKFDPKNGANRRGSLVGSKVNLLKPPQRQPEDVKPETPYPPTTTRQAPAMTQPSTTQRAQGPSRRVPGGRESRLKELAKLKYTSAARAAKMAFNEAHISMQANRRLSLQVPDHYLTMQTVAKIQGVKDKTEHDPSTNTKFINWRKKFKVGLQTNT